MLSTPDICCSMGVATACSTVAASAPVKVVCTWISGGAILGNWATGNSIMEARPSITIKMAMTIATMGLLMKNWAMELPPRCGGGFRERLWINLTARADLEYALGDYPFAGFQALVDQP